MTIKPAIILSVFVFIIGAVLIIMNEMVIPDTTGQITDKMQGLLTTLAGEGEYTMVYVGGEAETEAKTASASEGGASVPVMPEEVQAVIAKTDADTLVFHVITTGYNPGGVDVLVNISGGDNNPDADSDAGTVQGVAFLKNGETPGIGSQGADKTFLDKFVGVSEPVKIVKEASAKTDIKGLTGATYTSRGVAKAVNAALIGFKAYKAASTP